MWRRAWRLFMLPTGTLPTPISVGIGISVVCAFAALLRGLDLITLEAPPPAFTKAPDGTLVPTINIAVDYLGHAFWGWAFTLVALAIAASTVARRIVPLMFSHALAVGVYIGYAIVLTQGLYEQETTNGVRFVGSALAGASYSVLRLVLLIADLRGREYEEDA